MSDPWRQPDPGDRDRPGAEMPAAEQRVTPAPSAVLGEFARWLERWVEYTRARLALSDVASDESLPPIHSQPAKSPPAHWQAAVSNGPPAHWLALFSGQPEEAPAAEQPEERAEPSLEVIRRFQSELADFLAQPASPQTDGGLEGNAAAPQMAGEPAGVSRTAAPGLESPETTHATSQPDEPAGTTPARISRVRLRPPVPSRYAGPMQESQGQTPGGETNTPELVPEQASGPAAQPRVTHLRVSAPRQPGAGQRPAPAVYSGQEGQRAAPPAASEPTTTAEAGLPESTGEAELLVHRFSRPPDTADDPVSRVPAAERSLPAVEQPQPAAEQPLPVAGRHVQTAEQPSPDAEQPAQQPAWRQPPRPVEAPAVRWPAATNAAHWPELPDPRPPSDPGPRPYQNPARRRRIDREQGGSSWNG